MTPAASQETNYEVDDVPLAVLDEAFDPQALHRTLAATQAELRTAKAALVRSRATIKEFDRRLQASLDARTQLSKELSEARLLLNKEAVESKRAVARTVAVREAEYLVKNQENTLEKHAALLQGMMDANALMRNACATYLARNK